MSLPKTHRLTDRRDFNTVYQKGIRRSTACLILRGLRHSSGSSSSEQHPTQIGISVSQKVSKRAVVRNRIKRQIRAVLNQLLPQLSPGWRLVVVVRPIATQCDYEQFLQELKQMLADAEVLNEHS